MMKSLYITYVIDVIRDEYYILLNIHIALQLVEGCFNLNNIISCTQAWCSTIHKVSDLKWMHIQLSP